MTTDRYVCRCKCGTTFTTIYPSTLLCRRCTDRILDQFEDHRARRDTQQAARKEQAKVYAQTCEFSEGLVQHGWRRLSHRTRRYQPLLAFLLVMAVLFAMVWLGSMAQAYFQGWDR